MFFLEKKFSPGKIFHRVTRQKGNDKNILSLSKQNSGNLGKLLFNDFYIFHLKVYRRRRRRIIFELNYSFNPLKFWDGLKDTQFKNLNTSYTSRSNLEALANPKALFQSLIGNQTLFMVQGSTHLRYPFICPEEHLLDELRTTNEILICLQ